MGNARIIRGRNLLGVSCQPDSPITSEPKLVHNGILTTFQLICQMYGVITANPILRQRLRFDIAPAIRTVPLYNVVVMHTTSFARNFGILVFGRMDIGS